MTHRRLPKALGLLARELDAPAGLARDRHARRARSLAPCVIEQVAVLAVGGLLGHPEGARDLTPGRAGVQGPLDDLGLGGVELTAQCRERP